MVNEAESIVESLLKEENKPAVVNQNGVANMKRQVFEICELIFEQ